MSENKIKHMRKVLVLFIFLMLPRLILSEPIRLTEIKLANHDEVYALNKYKITITDAGRNYARALLSDREIELLKNAGYQVQILINDYKAYKDEIFNRGFYHTYNQVYLVLDSFVTNYPNLCHLDTIGNSMQGRPIWAMRVSDNPTVEENEAEVRLGGNIHGDEHIGTEVTLYFLRHLLTNYNSSPQVQNLVNNREIWILPTFNPDGKVMNTRGNANGIDLNRDYGFFWDGWGGSTGPSSQIENQYAMKHLAENNVSLEFNYHSAALYTNYPWDYGPADPPDSQHIINLSQIYADSSNTSMINGYDWYQVCGSLQDYTIGTCGALAWTIETDEPSGSSAIDQICYDNRNALMDIVNRAGWGIEGVVRDSVTNACLYARIEITSPQRIDIYSDPNQGDFHKMIQQGTYTIRVSANGYVPKTVSSVVVPATGSINLGDIRLAPNPNWLYAFKPVIARYSQHAEQSNSTHPRSATGANDNVFFSLGQGGFIVLDVGPSTPIVDISGNDFTVYEGNDGTSEGYAVRASNDWDGPWNTCGSGTGTTSFDLSPAGMSQARYIRIEDDNSSSSGQYAGFDLDAIGFLASLLGLPEVPTIVKPFNFAKLPVLQPILSIQSWDPQEDDIQYRIMWDTDPNFASPESSTTSTYPSGTIVDFTMSAPLTNGATYWWKVKCRDPAGSGYWTTYTAPRSFTIDSSLPANTCTWFQTTGTQFAYDLFYVTLVQGDSVVLSPSGQTIVDTVLYENFEAGGIPAGWTVVNGNGDAYMWTTGTTSDMGSYEPPDFGTQYAYYSDDDAGSGSVSNNEELISPKLYTGSVTGTLEILYGYGLQVYETGEKFRVKFRKKTGSTWTVWTNIAEYTTDISGSAAIDLTAQLPADSMQFEWFYSDSTASSHWGYACACDNVVLRYSYQLAGNQGTLTGTAVAYHDLAVTYPRQRWGDVVWRKAAAGDSIGMQVEYYNGATWQLVPNGLIPGNSAGKFSHLAVDTVKLTNVDTVTYNTLRLKALFYRITKAPGNPALLDWEVGNLSSYIGAEETEGLAATGVSFGLHVYPSIAKYKVHIAYSLGQSTTQHGGAQSGALKIYDASGRMVKSFALSPSSATQYGGSAQSIIWNGTDDAGRLVPAGVYFVKLEAGDQQTVQKTVVLR